MTSTCGVLVDDVERQLFGRDAALRRQPCFDRCGFATGDQVARADAKPVDQHRPLLDPALDARARVLRQELGKCLIQPLSGEIRGQIEAMGLELGGQPFGPMAGRGRYTSRVRRPFQTKDTGKPEKRQKPSMRAMRTAGSLALLILALGLSLPAASPATAAKAR